LVPFGVAGQDDLFVSAGTVLAITANPATTQGILFDNITVERIIPTFDGDFNHDNLVDAADYVVWRKSDGTAAGYNAWRTHFGQPAGDGSSELTGPAIPEPKAWLLLLAGILSLCLCRCRPVLNYSDDGVKIVTPQPW
jgi:hypothetical protein